MKQFLSSLFPTRAFGSEPVGPVDSILAAMTIGLLGFGVVMVFSASAIEATVVFDQPYRFLNRQATFALLGLGILWGVSRIDYHSYRRFTYVILALVTALMLASVSGLGHSGGGAARWLRLGPVHVQPSEMAKLALILWLAYSLAKKRSEQVKTFAVGMVPHFMMAGFLVLLCLSQPDFGGAVVLLFLTFTLLFVAGARIAYLALVGLAGSAVAAWLVRFEPYRWKRVLAWMHLSEHKSGLAYQPFQSVMSFGAGEFSGMGLGKGLQVLYLPEAHTDFVAAIIGEELGLIGIGALCLTYLVIVSRGVRVALAADDEYGSYVAFGISVLFGVQALINLAVAMSMLPTKGLTLPFVSYGGSSLLVNCAAMGVLLNVSRRRRPAGNHRLASMASPEASMLVAAESQASGLRRAFRGGREPAAS